MSHALRHILTLPVPPNANNYRGISWSGRFFFLRPEAKEYRSTVKARALAAGIATPFTGRISLGVDVYRARKSGDLDGFLKVLLDAMQESVYENDRQVVKLLAERHDDRANPRVEVWIEQLPEIRTVRIANGRKSK